MNPGIGMIREILLFPGIKEKHSLSSKLSCDFFCNPFQLVQRSGAGNFVHFYPKHIFPFPDNNKVKIFAVTMKVSFVAQFVQYAETFVTLVPLFERSINFVGCGGTGV